jgi:hypothetical protein
MKTVKLSGSGDASRMTGNKWVENVHGEISLIRLRRKPKRKWENDYDTDRRK